MAPRKPRQVGLSFTDELALAILHGDKTETRRPLFRSPKVQAGDELYGRVAFRVGEADQTIFRFQQASEMQLTEDEVQLLGPWSPGIHQPKARAPFFLPVVEVAEESLHDITEEGAKAEGAPAIFVTDLATFMHKREIPPSTHLNGFKSLWDGLYKGTPNAWEKNPCVRVYRWKKVRRC